MLRCRFISGVASVVALVLTAGSHGQDAGQRVDHLVKAAAHLQQAGCTDQAAQIRGLIAAEDPDTRLRLLDRKLESLAGLQAEIDQLRQSLTTVPQVLIRLRLLSFEPEKLENSGFPLVSLRQLLDQPAAIPVVDETGSLTRFLDTLQQEGLLKRIAEPTLAAIPGREASFFSGAELPEAESGTAGAVRGRGPHEIGTRLRCLARLDGDKISADLDFRHSALVPGSTQQAEEADADSGAARGPRPTPPAISAIQLRTTIEIASGQTVILGGLHQGRGGRSGGDAALILVLTMERVGPLP